VLARKRDVDSQRNAAWGHGLQANRPFDVGPVPPPGVLAPNQSNIGALNTYAPRLTQSSLRHHPVQRVAELRMPHQQLTLVIQEEEDVLVASQQP